MRPTTVLRALLAATLALGGCDAPPTGLDVGALEDDLFAALEPTYRDEGVTLFEVDCPHDATEAVGGDVLACVADVERRWVRIRVELASLDAWDWTTLDVVHVLDRTEELVGAEMSAALGDPVRLDCGSPRLRVLPVGSSLLCTATDSGGNPADALLTVNGPGQTAWRVLG